MSKIFRLLRTLHCKSHTSTHTDIHIYTDIHSWHCFTPFFLIFPRNNFIIVAVSVRKTSAINIHTTRCLFYCFNSISFILFIVITFFLLEYSFYFLSLLHSFTYSCRIIQQFSITSNQRFLLIPSYSFFYCLFQTPFFTRIFFVNFLAFLLLHTFVASYLLSCLVACIAL